MFVSSHFPLDESERFPAKTRTVLAVLSLPTTRPIACRSRRTALFKTASVSKAVPTAIKSDIQRSADSSETEFTGKRVLVTGGTRGIGEAIVQRLRGAGATVVTTARSSPNDLLQPDLFVEADLSTAEGAEKVVSAVRDRLGGVDILVHNVGGSSAPGGGFAALTDDEWQQALNSNLLAAVRLDRGLLPMMLADGSWRDHPHLLDPAAPPAV